MAESGRVASRPPAAHRRRVTILFSDLSDSTPLAGSLEPEQYLEVLNHLADCSRRIVTRHRGTLVDFRGDGLLAMFGYPDAAEDDGRRATEAAVDLHEAIREWHPPAWEGVVPSLNLHSGVHSGVVLIVDTDPGGRLSLVGEAPTVAARLSDAAGRNEILVSVTTLGAESHFFQTRDRGRLSLQGKADRVATCQVLGRSPAQKTRYRTQGGLTPFVGRAAARQRLEAHLRQAAEGHASRVSVVASAGMGKTRLVEEFLHDTEASGFRVCRGYCESTLGAEPLQPFLQMLRALCGLDRSMAAVSADTLDDHVSDLGPDLLPHKDLLRRAVAASLAPRSGDDPRQRVADHAVPVLGALFSALGHSAPLVLFIDDWQWVDDAAREVVGILSETRTSRLLLVTASRERSPREREQSPPEVSPRETEVLELTPLDDADAARAIQALSPQADPFMVRRILQLSGGNPLFIEELCHATTDDGGAAYGDRPDSRPAWLSTLIESRVARLPDVEADVVRTAAVIGAVVPCWLLEEISGCGDAGKFAERLADGDVLFPGAVAGTLRFKHGITRDVIYDSVGLSDRQALHGRIAKCLEDRSGISSQDEPFEALAYHYGESASHARAAHYAELAGDKAMAASALDRARTQYTEALTALDHLEPSDAVYVRWMSVARRLGIACVYDPLRTQLAVFERGADAAHARRDDGAHALCEYWLGYIAYGLGELTETFGRCQRALDLCRRALARARDTSNPAVTGELEVLEANILATLGQARAAAGEHDEALIQLNASMEIKRRYWRTGRPTVGSAYAIACKGAVYGDRGRFAEAHECFAEALDAVRGGNHAVKGSILAWQSAVYLWQGRRDEGLDAAAHAHAVAERIESLYVLAVSRALIGQATWLSAKSPEAIDSVVRAASWLESGDKRLFISLIFAWIADAMAVMGRPREARNYAAMVLGRVRQHDRLGEAVAYQAMALTAHDRNHSERIDRYLERAMTAARARGSLREEANTWLRRADIDVRRDARVEAKAAAERALALFESMDMPQHVSDAQRILSRAQTPPAAMPT